MKASSARVPRQSLKVFFFLVIIAIGMEFHKCFIIRSRVPLGSSSQEETYIRLCNALNQRRFPSTNLNFHHDRGRRKQHENTSSSEFFFFVRSTVIWKILLQKRKNEQLAQILKMPSVSSSRIGSSTNSPRVESETFLSSNRARSRKCSSIIEEEREEII